MRSERNVRAWLGLMPGEVGEATRALLTQVERMRSEQEIYPAQSDILNALAYTGPDEVRVVILGQDPYHGPGQAMGLSFSVPDGCRLPPSLRNIYKELAADLGCPAPTCGNLTSWAEQGVLLLNTTLTVRVHAANSHSALGWQTLTRCVVRTCMALPQPIVFLAWGRPSIGLIENARDEIREEGALVAGKGATRGDTGTTTNADAAPLATKLVLASTHPSPLSANRASADLPAFMGSRPFSQANHFLEQHEVAPVDWQRVG